VVSGGAHGADEPLVGETHAVIAGRTVSGSHFTPAMELESFLVDEVGIKTHADVYAQRLLANGVGSAEKFTTLDVETLAAEPYLFKKGHLRQVAAFRGEGPASVPGEVAVDV
jgi:hypothetical protein